MVPYIKKRLMFFYYYYFSKGEEDPTFACGGASQNVGNGVCEVLRSTDQTPLGAGNGKVLGPNYECSTDDQSRCEIGDQSG